MLDKLKEYLSINLKDYDNIGIDLEINKFLVILCAALCVSFFIINYKRAIISETVKQLLRHGAVEESAAKTLKELGLDSNGAVRRALSSDTQLRRMVAFVGEVKLSYEEYVAMQKARKKPDAPNLDEARLYVADGSLERAKHVYNSYNVSLLRTALLCVFCISVTVCLVLLSPELLTFIDSALA